MTRLTDEDLMAYADGTLDGDDLARVERHLSTDAEARALVASFRQTAGLSRDAFATPLSEPPPKALVDAILGHGSKTPVVESGPVVPAGANVVDLASRRRTRPAGDRWRLPLAASLALLIGLGAGYLANRGIADRPSELALGPIAGSAPFAEVLERSPAGATVGRTVVVATFRDKSGRICRELEILSAAMPAQPEAAAIACRGGNRAWTIEGVARLAVALPAGSKIEPSGVPERDALKGLLDMLGATQVLTPAEEKALIERAWK